MFEPSDIDSFYDFFDTSDPQIWYDFDEMPEKYINVLKECMKHYSEAFTIDDIEYCAHDTNQDYAIIVKIGPTQSFWQFVLGSDDKVYINHINTYEAA